MSLLTVSGMGSIHVEPIGLQEQVLHLPKLLED